MTLKMALEQRKLSLKREIGTETKKSEWAENKVIAHGPVQEV